MEDGVKLRMVYRIEGGILNGTEIEPFMFMMLVKYPHRKTPDCYVPPIKTDNKEIKTWHCCQEGCQTPDFEGKLESLVEHIILHKGRLLRPWSKRHQLQSPLPAITLPTNPYPDGKGGVNEDRRFAVQLYIDDVKHSLKKQGLAIIS